MSARIKTDDQVIVVGGKDRGKKGKVLRVEPAKNRVYVEGLNMVKRHTRPRQVAGAQRAEDVGGVIVKEPDASAPKSMSTIVLLTVVVTLGALLLVPEFSPALGAGVTSIGEPFSTPT